MIYSLYMDKEALLKRQQELQKEFDETSQKVVEAQAFLQQLRGAYLEIDQMLKNLEKPVEPEKQDENKA